MAGGGGGGGGGVWVLARIFITGCPKGGFKKTGCPNPLTEKK